MGAATWIVFSVILTYNVGIGHRFGYTKIDQDEWGKHHKSCGGQSQSPISINTFQAIPLRMPALETIRYHDLLPVPLKLHNNGHSVSLSVHKTNDSKYIPYIFGARLTHEYEFESLHFHWGKKNNRGSEHILNDIRYPMEMHVIHRNRKYKTVNDALQHSNGLTVLAFFYQLSDKENKRLAPLVKNLSQIRDYNSTMEISIPFTLASLLPSDMERFYTYRGSLTTPPCSEAVTWIVFPNALPVSVSQMRNFRVLSTDHDGEALVNNFRILQPINNRRIFMRRMFPKTKKYNISIPYSEWDWII